MGYQLGVDLGTTFVAAALSLDSQVEMFTLGDRSVVTPAVVYLREDGSMVSGEAASRRAASSPDRVGREFKRRLGDPTPVMLGGTPHSPTDLLAQLLRDVLVKVTETEGVPPQSVVLTHPANWGGFRRGLFEEVPRLAGLVETVTITEPEAAAAHYAASRDLDNGETVAVYDLGGGTFDVTVLRKAPGGVEIVGTPEGIERLGGIDFDDALLQHIDHVSGGAISELDARESRNIVALARLRQDCVLAKESLSVDRETVLPVFLPGRNFDVTITRAEFEGMVRRHVESTVGALSRALRSAQVAPGDLSAVLLVGGSSRIPLVAEMVSEELGRPTLVDTHPKYAVALGAATVASANADSGTARQAPLPTRPAPIPTLTSAPITPPPGPASAAAVLSPVPAAPHAPARPPTPPVLPPQPAPALGATPHPPVGAPSPAPPTAPAWPPGQAVTTDSGTRNRVVAAVALAALAAFITAMVVVITGTSSSTPTTSTPTASVALPPAATTGVPPPTEDPLAGRIDPLPLATLPAATTAPITNFLGDRACAVLTEQQRAELGVVEGDEEVQASLRRDKKNPDDATCAFRYVSDDDALIIYLNPRPIKGPQPGYRYPDFEPITIAGRAAHRRKLANGTCIVGIQLGPGVSGGSVEMAGGAQATPEPCARLLEAAEQVVSTIR